MRYARHISGRNAGHVVFFALSTCVWCKKTKKLLAELKVAHDLIEMDTLDWSDRAEAEAEHARWASSFPTLVIDGKTVIEGFHENEIREALS